MSAIDLSADIGLLAVFLATANICLGLLIATRYSPVRFWPHRRINLFAIHNSTAYLFLATIILHPVLLLFSSSHRFRLIDIALPVRSPVQPLENTVGAFGLFLAIIVVATSYWRLSLGRRYWKRFHYLVYAAVVAILIHSLLTDATLKGLPIDFADGGKVFVEICALVLITSTVWAMRNRARKTRENRSRVREAANGPLATLPIPAPKITRQRSDSNW